MAKNLGLLSIAISANSSSFTRELNRVDQRVTGFASNLRRRGGGIDSIFTAATRGARALATGIGVVATAATAMGTAIVGGLFAFNQATASLDELAKSADRLQTAPDVLRQLQFASEQTGSSFESLSTAGIKLQEQLGAALTGQSAAASEGLRALGLTAEELIDLDFQEQLGAISDGLNSLPSAAERARASVVLFGRSGRDLATLLAQGSEGINELVNQARDLGIVFDRQALGAVERARDAVNALSTSAGALKDRFLIELAPAVEFIAGALTNLITGFSANAQAGELWGVTLINWFERAAQGASLAALVFTQYAATVTEAQTAALSAISSLIEGVANLAIRIVNFTQDAILAIINSIPRAINAVGNQLENFVSRANALPGVSVPFEFTPLNTVSPAFGDIPTFNGASQLFRGISAGSGALRRGSSNIRQSGIADAAIAGFFAQARGAGEVASQFAALQEASQSAANSLAGGGSSSGGGGGGGSSSGGGRSLADAAQEAADNTIRMSRAQLDGMRLIAQAREALSRGSTLSGGGTLPSNIGLGQFPQGTTFSGLGQNPISQFENLGFGDSPFQTFQEEVNTTADIIKNNLGSAIDGVADSFFNALQSGEDFAKSLATTLLQAIQSFAKELLTTLLRGLIFRSIFGGGGGGFGLGNITSSIGGVGSSLSGASGFGFGAFSLPLTPFARGGVTRGATPALIGEAGPEAVIPLNRAGDLFKVTVNNNAAGVQIKTSQRDRELVVEAVSESRKAVEGDFNRSLNSGYGAYSRGLRSNFKLNQRF